MNKKIIFIVLIGLVLLALIGLSIHTYQFEHSLNQRLFSAGSQPKNLDGFYNGIIRFKTPWQGKEFNATDSAGINVVNLNGKESKKFPFKTFTEGNVLVLDYNISKNPLLVRTIRDELVEVAENQYLGKAYLSFFGLKLPLLFFRLTDSTPTALPPPDYQIVLLGDSMTESLGNSEILKSNLEKLYPDKVFLMLNYGYGATNILSAKDRLTTETQHGRAFQPIMDIDFSLILIESFGHNPLSQYPLQEGLQKQNEALDEIVKIITEKKPKSSLVFVGTIAPSKEKYASKTVDLSDKERARWADERSAYIKNHMEYARTHNIPVIDIYSKSLKNGDADLKYIRGDDYIHPSPEGLFLISSEIANFITENRLLGTLSP